MTAGRLGEEPEHTAVRVALWRALHVQMDAQPHVFTDELGAIIAAEADSEFSKPMAMANEAGFKTSKYVSAADLYQRYFTERVDGLRAGNAEAFLLATS